MSVIANPPFPSYFDTDGTPLENGYLYFGTSGQNPETNPIAVYWDSAYTQPAAQPIRTSGGFAWRDGSPANIYVSTDFSMTVRDKNKRLVYSKLVSDAQTGGSVNLQFSRQSITATAGQTVFPLSSSYTPGNNTLAVYSDGLLLAIGSDYIETSSTAVTLTSGAYSGQEFTFLIGSNINTSSVDSDHVIYTSALTGSIDRTVKSKLDDIVSIFDFMTQAQIADIKAKTHSIPITTEFQKAVTEVCGASKTLLLPAGVYVLTPTSGKAISFPNTSFKIIGEGPTDTAVSLDSTSQTDRIFDFSGCNGPAKLISDLSLNAKIGAGSFTSVGAYFDNTNGLVIRGVWFRGLYTGSRKLNTSSGIDLIDCVSEYCGSAINWDDAVACSIQNKMFYRNLVDAYFTGDLDNLTATNWRHLSTVNYGIRFVGANNGKFGHLSFRQDFTTNTPDLVRLEGVCSNINIGLVSSVGFGRAMVSIASGATVTGCDIKLSGKGAIPVGVEIGSGNTGNTFSGAFNGLGYGVVDTGGSNFYNDLSIIGCTTAGVLQSSCTDNSFSRVRFSGNAVDWVTSGSVATTWLDEVDTTMVGLTPTRFGSRRAGIYGRTFYGTAVPGSLAYLKGDRVVNVNPAVGSPKAWTCTVAGTPGTWVSEGNL